jgi:hypothetical protein
VFQELLTLSLELPLTTILQARCATWNDVKVEEKSFDGMTGEGKAAKVMSSINSVQHIVREGTLTEASSDF